MLYKYVLMTFMLLWNSPWIVLFISHPYPGSIERYGGAQGNEWIENHSQNYEYWVENIVIDQKC